MKNYKSEGKTLTLTPPVGGVVSGTAYKIGRFFGVAAYTVTAAQAAAGATCELQVEGVFELPKDASTITQGESIYWDDTAGKVSDSAAGGVNMLVGCAMEAAATGVTVVDVRLNGIAPDTAIATGVYQTSHRLTVAEVNTGHTILAAVAGYKYRILDAAAIAIGGAVGKTTTIDLLGTQSAAGVKLVAWAQANLTQSTLLRAGGTGAAILADGASFVACDENTAITVGKTGDNADTATHVDVLVTYALDAA